MELWGFQFEGTGFPKFSAPSNGETMHRIPKNFRDARMCSRSFINMPRLVRLGFHPPPSARAAKDVEFLVCLSVCPSRFWTTEFLHMISPWSCWSTETVLMPLDGRRFAFEHPCSTFSDCHQLATPENAEPKSIKIWGFRRQRAIK